MLGEYKRQAEGIDSREATDIASLDQWRATAFRAAGSEQEKAGIEAESQTRLADIRDAAVAARKVLGKTPSVGAEVGKALVPVAVAAALVGGFLLYMRKK